MQANVIWASEAPKNNVAAPSTDKQKQGWIKEVPPPDDRHTHKPYLPYSIP